MVNRLRRGRAGVELRFDDPTQTPDVGLLLVAELADRLDLVATLDRHIGPVKQRRRGLGGGALVMALAESMLVGGDFLCDLDTLRADVAGAALRTIACPPAPTTAAELARRFGPTQLGGIETALAEVTARAVALLPTPRRRGLQAVRPTVDLDPTDVEVYGANKQGVGWTYAGKRCGRPVLVTWAEAGVALAGELVAGNDDARPIAPGLVRRALAALPSKAGLGRPRVRADAGLFSGQVAHAAVAAGADFGIAAKRNSAVWRAISTIPDDAWQPARGMPGAEVARVAYAPAGWPEGTYAVVRRVRVAAEAVSADPRARRRRTFAPGQLRLALGGDLDELFSYSMIVTNIDDDPVSLEAWFRERTQIEERIKDSKLGMALRHLPSGAAEVNAVWMWAALLALNCSAWLQALTGLDTDGRGRAHGKRLRRELIGIPGRLVRHAGRLIVRVAPRYAYLGQVRQRLAALPVPAG
jgi:Transposase DDE domain group 1